MLLQRALCVLQKSLGEFVKERNMKRAKLLGIVVVLSVCWFGAVQPVRAAFFGIGGDSVSTVTETETVPGYIHYRVINSPADSMWAYFVFDLGSVKNISSFVLTNRTDVTTGYNIDLFNIYDATDETVAGFDPTVMTSYDKVVYSSSYDGGGAGEIRPSPLFSAQNKQYFMFEVSSINSRWYGTTTSAADFDSLVAVPEPGILTLLAVGALGLLRKRK
jgi:hypothetical protein